MTALLFVLFFLVSFLIGSAATFFVVSLVIREDVKNGEGVFVTYREKDDRWLVFGDVDETINKMRNHFREPEVFNKARLDKLEAESKAKRKAAKARRWYRK